MKYDRSVFICKSVARLKDAVFFSGKEYSPLFCVLCLAMCYIAESNMLHLLLRVTENTCDAT